MNCGTKFFDSSKKKKIMAFDEHKREKTKKKH